MWLFACNFALSLAEKQILGNQTRSWGAMFFFFFFLFFSLLNENFVIFSPEYWDGKSQRGFYFIFQNTKIHKDLIQKVLASP